MAYFYYHDPFFTGLIIKVVIYNKLTSIKQPSDLKIKTLTTFSVSLLERLTCLSLLLIKAFSQTCVYLIVLNYILLNFSFLKILFHSTDHLKVFCPKSYGFISLNTILILLFFA